MQYGQLGIGDTEKVLHWFLYHMPMEQRGELMAELPQQYAGLFPDVDPGIITAAVRRKLNETRMVAAEQKLAAAS